jgi:hypothetical protein
MVVETSFPKIVNEPVTLTSSQWELVRTAVTALGGTGTTWVLLTSSGGAGETITLALLEWNPSQSPPTIQPPVTGAPVHFEVYNASGSRAGTL